MNTSILYEYNPWWVNPDSIDDDRNIKTARIESPRKEYSFQDNNLLLIGPRQVGKTTYMKLVIRDLIRSKNVDPKQVLYFSFTTDKSYLIQLVTIFNRKEFRFVILR